jgi:hypothetical protein
LKFDCQRARSLRAAHPARIASSLGIGFGGGFKAQICRHFELADFREQGIAFGARDKLICVIQILLNRTGKTFIESIGFVVLLRHGANS